MKGLAFIIREAIFLPSLKFFFNYLNKNKIASKEARFTDNPRELMMAENVAKIIAATPYFKDGFLFKLELVVHHLQLIDLLKN